MADLKLKVKKAKMVRKIDGVKKEGFYGRVITNGTKTWEQIAEEASRNTTVHKAEMKVASELLLDAVTAQLKQGFIVDLGPIGKLYPAVNGKWDENADNLQLADMKPKVNYKAGADIEAAVKGAQLSWTTEAETDENTVTDDDNTQTGGNTGGNTQGGDLEG
jgi:nucleoid DNA-binding protein